VDQSLGLAFHSDSAFLRGIHEKTSPECRAGVNGFVMPSRSENDTGNNPHNPIYGINLAGAKGDLVYSVASRNNDVGGGNSRTAAKFMQFDEFRETKVDRGSDALGLVKVGSFDGLSADEVVSVMESVSRMSNMKIQNMNPGLGDASLDSELRRRLECTYVESASLAFSYPDPNVLDIALDDDISEIFPGDELNDREFQKTASVMKLALGGAFGARSSYAGAGHISMGGYDYHGQGRATGEQRDLRAGRCIGACLEYAFRQQVPVMIAVYSDGSLSANGTVDNSTAGRGKFMWQSDNQNTRSQFCLVFDPNAKPVLRGNDETQMAAHQQLGYMNPDGNVNTGSSPMANNAESGVDCLVLNYLALHGLEGEFASLYATRGLSQALGSSPQQLDRYIAFQKLGSVDESGEVSTQHT